MEINGNIKLVIWDLDDTFWSGTLSDGEITPIQPNIELIKTLTDRGIINSICSKNDFEQAKAKLTAFGVWDLFVFPSIDWEPKGIRVKKIIDDMQLRAENVLFVDDNINNLKEAEFACTGLQTTIPDKLAELVKAVAFESKDDSSHSRLQQYKVLEQKAIAKTEYGSNEDFLYQSEIKVEMIEDCSDVLERMHEMIHRNNQLNFTKDRISREESDSLFTDENVRSGYVKVTDKYGDHGIIGCYAIKDGRLVQFVFSCRILGMGVEQYVYAELNYPKIEVVGEVAGELKQDEKPDWINNRADENDKKTETESFSGENCPKLFLYGTCTFEPISAYLESKLSDAKFTNINPAPSTCNIAVTIRENAEQKAEWLSKVFVFNEQSTFDIDFCNGKFDYLFVTLNYELQMRKYTSKNRKSWFYSIRLDRTTAHESIFEDYTETAITFEDIEDELRYICEHLQKNTTLLILTIPEVEFINCGKDINYNRRIKLNKIVEKLSGEYKNLKKIDIRKYAKSPVYFRDQNTNHFNRFIGFSVAKEILETLGVSEKEEIQCDLKKQTIMPPINAVHVKNDVFGNIVDVPEYIAYIRNGFFYVEITMQNIELYEFGYEFWQDRYIAVRIEFQSESTYKLSINKPGLWFVKVSIRKRDDYLYTYNFGSPKINYSQLNYISYFDPNADNYEQETNGINQFYNENTANYNRGCRIISQIAILAAMGVNTADYFLEHGIDEISLFTNKQVGEVLLPFLHNSKLKIRNLYTVDSCYDIFVNGDMNSYHLNDINTPPPLSEKDCLFFAYDFSQFPVFRETFNKSKCKQIMLPYVLNCLLTKKIFVEKFRNLPDAPLVISCRLPVVVQWHTFPYVNITPNEKVAHMYLKNNVEALKKINTEFEQFPAQYYDISREELQETLQMPSFFNKPGTFVQTMRDVKGEYLNIENGFRKTMGQPESSVGTVYIFGGYNAFGCGVKDSETVASQLQKILNLPYKVENYANCWNHETYSTMLRLIDSMTFKKNDIVVVLQANWQGSHVSDFWHWLNWDAMEKPVIKADAWPIFQKAGRPDYFLLPQAINAEGNLRIAEVLRDTIYENIQLF
jgi:FkbH-like protein